MNQSNLQTESTDPHESRPLQVAILGFAAADEENFARFFQVSRIGKPTYVAASPSDRADSDILMVNYDNMDALKAKDSVLAENPHIQVVAVSKGPLEPPPEYHIRGMLFAARVLTTLDKLVPETDVEPPQAIVGISSQQVIETPASLAPVSLEAKPALAEIAPTQEATPVVPLAQPIRVEPHTEQKPITHTQMAHAEVEIPASPTPVQAGEKANETGGYRCLVVDDSIAIQKSLELNLVTLPQISQIDFADSGEIALQKTEAVQYDLIFLDVMMPGIDGYETCTRLRKKPEYKKTPIIMVSGKTSPLDEVKGVMAGCTTYLTKPVQQEAFQKLSVRVLTWLEKQKKP